MIKREYHKNEWCDKIDRTCTEGYCDNCEAYSNPINKKELVNQ